MIKKILLGFLILGMVAFAAILIFNAHIHYSRVQLAEKPWSVNSESRKGAPITIVDFVDYSCPYCHEFHPILHTATKDDEQFNIIIKPVGLLGENSEKIAMIILAAGLQKQDGHLHNLIMTTLPHPFTPDDVYNAAATIPDINMDKLREDSIADEMKIIMRQNNSLFYALGFNAVPTILINGRSYSPTDEMPDAKTLKSILTK